MIGWLRTAAFFVGWVLFTGLFGVVAVPLLLSQKASVFASHVWVSVTLAWLRITCGIRTHVRGVPGSALIASKHQSAWDTLVLWRTLKHPAFVLKRELYWIPVFGWFLWRTGQIAIDRRNKRDAMRTILARAQTIVAQGRSIVIFPEGTRIAPGVTHNFHAGAARLSDTLQLPVTPVALNAGYFWPKHTAKKLPGVAVLEFLPPVPVFHEPLGEWLANLQSIVNTRSDALAPRTV